MKRILAGLFAALLCLTACAAGDAAREPEPASPAGPAAPSAAAPLSRQIAEELPDPEPVWTAGEGVTFSLLQDAYPVGTTELTLVVDNRSHLEISWGVHQSYEKYVDGAWQPVEFVGGNGPYFPEYERVREPHTTETWTLRMLSEYQPLEEGLYRVTGSDVFMGCENAGAWQVSFRVAAEAQPEPDYALYISGTPIPTVEGCQVTDRIPAYLINTTGEDAAVLLIPHLEKLDGSGEWAEVPWKEGVGFCGTPDPLPKWGKEWSWELSMLWGGLEDGQYRIGVACQPYTDSEVMAYGTFTLFTPENSGGLPLRRP